MFHDIGKASCHNHVFDSGLDVQFFTRSQTACHREVPSFVESVTRNLGAVIGPRDRVDLALLQIAAGFEVTMEVECLSAWVSALGGGKFGGHKLKTFFIESRPIGHAAIEEPDMYVVEMVLWVHPLAAAVVDHKADIGGRVVRLHGRKVGCFVT